MTAEAMSMVKFSSVSRNLGVYDDYKQQKRK